MTREEAIEILLSRDSHGMLCGYTNGYTEALDMAIEALEYIEKHKNILDLVNAFAELGFDTNKIIWSAQEWIPCSERLPEEKTKVLICGGCGIQVAEIIKGITEETREKMKQGSIEDPDVKGWNSADGWTTFKRSRAYEPGDVHGNNLVPYAWKGDGPAQWFGQDADAWMPLPEPWQAERRER